MMRGRFIPISQRRRINLDHLVTYIIRLSKYEHGDDREFTLAVTVELTLTNDSHIVYEPYVDEFLAAVGNDLTVEQIKADYRANDGE